MTLKGTMEWKLCSAELWPVNAFVMLKTTFSKHQLIKISIIHMYIKPEFKKKTDTKAMTTAINETCIGWLHENWCLMGEVMIKEMIKFIKGFFFWLDKYVNFGCLVGFSSHPLGFPWSFRGRRRVNSCWGQQSNSNLSKSYWRYLFSQCLVCDQKRNGVRKLFCWGLITNKLGKFCVCAENFHNSLP